MIPKYFPEETDGNSVDPVLFLVYINDLPEYLKSSQLRLFAEGL
jgi:hypothetical protein